MRLAIAILIAFLLNPRTCLAQSHVSDEQIAKKVAAIIDKELTYRNVQFDVDDHIVMLTGTVELLSQKESLEYRIERQNGVARVVNLIVLNPPTISDEILLARLNTRLAIWADRIRWTVRDGRVELRGTLPRQQCARLIANVWNIAGVREVKSSVQILQNQ